MDCTAFLAALKLCTTEPEDTALSYTKVEQAECLTKEQARKAYPGAWLYWHGKNHCWDNRGPAHRRPSLPVKEKTFAKTTIVADASGNTMQRRVPRIEVFYPALIQEQSAIATDIYTVQRPITEWPLMLDLDAAGPDPDNGIDGCCWPPLEQLMARQSR